MFYLAFSPEDAAEILTLKSSDCSWPWIPQECTCTMVLKLQWTSELPGGCIKRCLGPIPRASDSVGLGWCLRFCFWNKFSGINNFDSAVHGPNIYGIECCCGRQFENNLLLSIYMSENSLFKSLKFLKLARLCLRILCGVILPIIKCTSLKCVKSFLHSRKIDC